MSESFGMQLDDDSLLALFSWVSTCSMGHRCSMVHKCSLGHYWCSMMHWCSACCCHAAQIRGWPPPPYSVAPHKRQPSQADALTACAVGQRLLFVA